MVTSLAFRQHARIPKNVATTSSCRLFSVASRGSSCSSCSTSASTSSRGPPHRCWVKNPLVGRAARNPRSQSVYFSTSSFTTNRTSIRHFSDFFKDIKRPVYPQYATDADEPLEKPHKVKTIEVTFPGQENNPSAKPLIKQVDQLNHKRLVQVFQEYETEIPVEAACDGIAACSTCHCYIHEEDYKLFPEPDYAELDMLDLAADPVEGRSRLACQMKLHEFKGGENGRIRLTLPRYCNNLMDFIPFEDPK
ncbi:unnamed protein product [Amoebophrya sp. A120]|nr:unnamed protein product [Amoebophrya sp. A120]|eukprot:GSA120T00013821001.1